MPADSVRFQMTMDSMGRSPPRSNSHHGLFSFSAVWVCEPAPKRPLVLPSMALEASPPLVVEDWVALPDGAMLAPWLMTWTSASVSGPLRGSSMRTKRPWALAVDLLLVNCGGRSAVTRGLKRAEGLLGTSG